MSDLNLSKTSMYIKSGQGAQQITFCEHAPVQGNDETKLSNQLYGEYEYQKRKT